MDWDIINTRGCSPVLPPTPPVTKVITLCALDTDPNKTFAVYLRPEAAALS